MRNSRVILLLLCLCQQFNGYGQEHDTIKLYFDINVSTLSSSNQKKIDEAIYSDQIRNGESIFIIGYADYLGGEHQNKTLSMARAKNVASYLEQYDVRPADIKLCMGKGEVVRNGPHNPSGYAQDRRVDVVVRDKKMNMLLATDTTKTYLANIAAYKPGQTLRLKNIYFLPERHIVTTQSLPELQQLYEVLKQHPSLCIKIEGHVCCIQNYADAYDADNNDNQLSVNRAKYIYDYLVKKGISPARLQYTGYGRSRPVVAFERDEHDAQLNRRVEIRVIKN